MLYKLTDAGEFWTVNLTQSTLEAVEYIMTGKNSFAIEAVAAQDTKTTSKENPNQEVRGMARVKPISLYQLMKIPKHNVKMLSLLRLKLKLLRAVLLAKQQNEWYKLCTI